VLLPPCRYHRLCAALIWWGRVREGGAWMAITSSDRRLGGGGVAKGAPKPDGTVPPPIAACGVAEPDGTPPLVGACGVVDPAGAVPLRSPVPPPPPMLPPPTPRLHVVSGRGSPPSSRVVAPALAGSWAGLLSAVYNRSHRRCRPTTVQRKLQR
jgi:hypothetical protein